MKFEPFGEAIDRRRLVLVVLLPLALIVAAAIIFVPPGLWRLAALLFLALPFLFLSIDRPALVFYVLMFVLFSNLDVFVHFSLFRYILIFFLAVFALALAGGRKIITHHPLAIAFLGAFAILAIQSVAAARDSGASITRLGVLFKIILGIAIIAQFARDRRELQRFYLILAAAILVSGLLPFAVRPPSQGGTISVIWSQGVVRYEGFVFEPNTLALYQLFLVPLLIFSVGISRRMISRLIFILAILASIMVLILSFSRGGFIGLAFLLITLIIVERDNKPLFLFGLALVVASVFLVPGVYWDRVRSLLDTGAKGAPDFAIMTRIETMKTALKLGLEHPLFGVGIDNFLYHASRFTPYPLVVHSAYLQIFAELGVIAPAVLAGMIAYNLVILLRLMGRRDDPAAVQLGRALLMQQVAVLVTAFFIPVAYEMTFWFTLAFPALAEYAYRREGPLTGEERIPSA